MTIRRKLLLVASFNLLLLIGLGLEFSSQTNSAVNFRIIQRKSS